MPVGSCPKCQKDASYEMLELLQLRDALDASDNTMSSEFSTPNKVLMSPPSKLTSLQQKSPIRLNEENVNVKRKEVHYCDGVYNGGMKGDIRHGKGAM